MRAISLLLALLMMIGEANGQQSRSKEKTGWQKILDTLAPPKKEKAKPKSKSSKRKTKTVKRSMRTPAPTLAPIPIATPRREASPRTAEGYFIVDAAWMANYWEQELQWDYPIPEDDEIQFIDGKYYVPPVVYRHYEDMVNTARATPKP